MKKLFLIILFLLNNIIFCEEEEGFNDFENNEYYNEYDTYYANRNNIDIVSITYELTYNNFSVVKVIIKSYDEIIKDINFKAYLKSEEEDKNYLLNCENTYYDTIECLSKRNISLNIEDKFYFYYEKDKKENITFDGEDIFEDNNRISLVFKPEIPSNLKLYKDNRKFLAHTEKRIIDGGYLYIVRKSKNILHKPKDGFNKYIELNNFISDARLLGYPPSSFLSYVEAIKRGYHIVDANIQFSKDKIPIIYHLQNFELKKNTKSEISSKTLAELNKIDFGSIFDIKFKGEKILTFEKLLDLCKENDVIIDLNLTLLEYNKYFNNTNEYLKIIINLIQKYEMFDSILFNDNRQEVILKFKNINNDISFSLNNMSEKKNLDKINNELKDSNRLIYNMDGFSSGKKIDEEKIKYALSLGQKIQVSDIDDINMVENLQTWGVNYIKTNNLHPFLIKNEKEEPIIVRCSPSSEYEYHSECEIDDDVILKDNEIYNVYYSENIYNISENINEDPIAEFEYIDTNILEELYYNISYFNFEEGIILLNTSNKVKKGEQIEGIVGPDYDDAVECYQYNFICEGTNTHYVKCRIQKYDENKVEFKGNYSIYSLEGYSLNPEKVIKKIDAKRLRQRVYFYILVGIFVLIIFMIMIALIKKRRRETFNEMKISDNNYISNDNLYR